RKPRLRLPVGLYFLTMLGGPLVLIRILCCLIIFLTIPIAWSTPASSWKGAVHDAAGKPLSNAVVTVRHNGTASEFTAHTSANGEFVISGLTPGDYSVTVRVADKQWAAPGTVVLAEGALLIT